MSHLRMLQPDPSDPAPQPRAIADPEEDSDPGLFLAHLTSALAAHGGGAGSIDLALDLVLNQIVEQARLATTATAAAIALTRGEQMVCRATTGPNAPGLGLRLTTRSGLSGACVTTRQVQRCDDTEIDPRVDAAACGDLAIRSILVVPVLDGEELVGVFEIFSPRSHAFSDRDVQTLQALSLRIVSTLHRATEAAAEPVVAPAPAEESEPATTVQTFSPEPPPPAGFGRVAAQPREYWVPILTMVVVALALLLGWMIGRAGWQRAIGTYPPKAVRAQKAPLPTTAPATMPPLAAPPAPDKKPAVSTGSAAPDTSLVVYQDGKVIFRMRPAGKSFPPETPASAVSTEDASLPATGLATMAPEVASDYLIQRVEPEYPEAARLQRVQGDVTVDAIVAKDGTVREVRPVSGDSRLAAAAIDAVRQWRFKPYSPKGQPVEFQTRIVVKFALP